MLLFYSIIDICWRRCCQTAKLIALGCNGPQLNNIHNIHHAISRGALNPWVHHTLTRLLGKGCYTWFEIGMLVPDSSVLLPRGPRENKGAASIPCTACGSPWIILYCLHSPRVTDDAHGPMHTVHNLRSFLFINSAQEQEWLDWYPRVVVCQGVVCHGSGYKCVVVMSFQARL